MRRLADASDSRLKAGLTTAEYFASNVLNGLKVQATKAEEGSGRMGEWGNGRVGEAVKPGAVRAVLHPPFSRSPLLPFLLPPSPLLPFRLFACHFVCM